MKSSKTAAAIALAAAVLSTPLLAGNGGHSHDPCGERALRAHASELARDDSGMQIVANGAIAGDAGHGWQYFSAPGQTRAVVISPLGDYYYSHGKGLRWVAAAKA